MGLNLIGLIVSASVALSSAGAVIFGAVESAATAPWMLIVVGLITSGALTAFINLWFNRRKNTSEIGKVKADTADVIQEAAGEIVIQMREQLKQMRDANIASDAAHAQQVKELMSRIAELQKKVDELPALRRSVEHLSRGVDLLVAQLEEHGIRPAFTPNHKTLF